MLRNTNQFSNKSPNTPAHPDFTASRIVVRFLLVFAMLIAASTATFAQRSPDERQLVREEQANVNVFRQSSPSVVNISTGKSVAVQRGDVTLNIGRLPAGAGSGFLWNKLGHVVTNYHVVEGSDFVKVKLTDGSEWEAEKHGEAPEFDIAVLKINAPEAILRPLAIGQSDNLEVGQKVYAIGNPFGLDDYLRVPIRLASRPRQNRELTMPN